MFDISVITTDGQGFSGDNATYSLSTEQGLLIVETASGTSFINWNHVIYFGASPVGA